MLDALVWTKQCATDMIHVLDTTAPSQRPLSEMRMETAHPQVLIAAASPTMRVTDAAWFEQPQVAVALQEYTYCCVDVTMEKMSRTGPIPWLARMNAIAGGGICNDGDRMKKMIAHVERSSALFIPHNDCLFVLFCLVCNAVLVGIDENK